jgi:phosphoribosylaminoimidazolecarboxamide formyltransferase/IMP cyclohydrolase
MTPDNYKISKALISVSDKTGIVDFAKKLNSIGVEIYSTGGTYSLLSKEGISVHSVSELTKFPEILDGRVKTLHPAVHAGLLADLGNPEHLSQLQEHHLSSIDLLIVNLYPFEETLKKVGASHEELIENIDIGGPTMLRAAAKNYRWTATIVEPSRYDEIWAMLENNNGCIPENFRAMLAGDVFSHTAYYDSLISDYFNFYNKIEYPEKLSIAFKEDQPLRYGENPHQKAKLYGSFTQVFQQLHGKELSFNNIIDIDSASKLILEFEEEPTVAIIKHTNPCGVGTGNNLSEAYHRAFSTDTVSPFGGIISVNRVVDLEFAQTVHPLFAEVIIAPEYTDEALEILKKKKDRRLIKVDFQVLKETLQYDFRSVAGGLLLQSFDSKLIDSDAMKVVTRRQPSDDEWKALMFAWRVAKHVKSNAIVFTSSNKTIGIGAGQMSRVDSTRIATEKAKIMNLDLKNSVVASDAFFPFADGLLQAAEYGITAVIQPGGSVRDEEVIAAADDNNIAMVFTGARHFKH